jgi:hypothetical protein
MGGILLGFFSPVHKAHLWWPPRRLMNVQYRDVTSVVPNVTCLGRDLQAFLLIDSYHSARLLGTSQRLYIKRGLLSSVCVLESD